MKNLSNFLLRELSAVRESVNIDKLAKLLESDTAITMEPEVVLHTWADNPKTVSALALIQLGIFASDREISRNNNFLNSVIRCKIIEKLMVFIQSEERDKYEAGVLALSFLTENNSEIIEAILRKKVLGTLVKFMRDKKEGLKATAALCCRNLYLARPAVQKQFISEGGAELLLGLLDSDDSITVFETILNILDLLLDPDDTIQPDVKKHLITLGIQYHLQRVMREISRYEPDTIREAEKLSQLFD